MTEILFFPPNHFTLKLQNLQVVLELQSLVQTMFKIMLLKEGNLRLVHKTVAVSASPLLCDHDWGTWVPGQHCSELWSHLYLWHFLPAFCKQSQTSSHKSIPLLFLPRSLTTECEILGILYSEHPTYVPLPSLLAYPSSLALRYSPHSETPACSICLPSCSTSASSMLLPWDFHIILLNNPYGPGVTTAAMIAVTKQCGIRSSYFTTV